MSIVDNQCMNCIYWIRGFRELTEPFDWQENFPVYAAKLNPWGDCRRLSPIATPAEGGSGWARTHEKDGCGEYCAKDEFSS